MIMLCILQTVDIKIFHDDLMKIKVSEGPNVNTSYKTLNVSKGKVYCIELIAVGVKQWFGD